MKKVRHGPQQAEVPRHVVIKKADLTSIFTVSSKELGYGKFGSVREARSLSDQTLRVALKSIAKTKMLIPNQIQSEVDIWALLDHPFVAKFYKAIEDQNHFHIAIELCEGGTLSTKVKQMSRLAEQVTKRLFLQSVLAVKHLHDRGIVHRDIKLSNFLFKSKSPDSDIRLVDFGLACLVGDAELTGIVGTPGYMAPEIMQGKYTAKVDIWSLGILLYNMLSGVFPFQLGSNSVSLNTEPSLENLEFPDPIWREVSSQAKDLIKKLLAVKPEKRPECEHILQEPWLHSLYQDLLLKGKKNLPLSLATKLQLSLVQQQSLIENEKNAMEEGSPVYKRIRSDVSMLKASAKEAPAIFTYLDHVSQHNTTDQSTEPTDVINYSTLLELLRE